MLSLTSTFTDVERRISLQFWTTFILLYGLVYTTKSYVLIPKRLRCISSKNCKKLPLFRWMRKNEKENSQNSTMQICTRILCECVNLF